jgi:WD40 repeat protein
MHKKLHLWKQIVQGPVTALCSVPPTASISMQLLASGSADRKIQIWDPKKGSSVDPPALVQTLYRHDGTVTAICNPVGYLVTGGTDCSVHMWRISEDCLTLLYPTFEYIRVLATMPAWVTSISNAPICIQEEKDELFVSDSAANVLRIMVSMQCVLASFLL